MTDSISRRKALALGGLGSAAVALGLAGAAAGDTEDKAEVIPEHAGGATGLVPGQVARLMFVHHSHGLAEGVSEPCLINARIRGFDGKVLGEVSAATPGANQGGFVDYVHAASDAKRGLASRIHVFGEIEHTAGHLVGGSLEVLDGKTGLAFGVSDPCIVPVEASTAEG